MEEGKLHSHPLQFDGGQRQQIDRCLLHLADQIGSPLVMLADVSGRLVLYRGRLSSSQSTGLAALAAGGFAAGKEIGHFLGLRNSFQHQLLEGDLANLYILAVGPELLLIVAFTKQTMLGMVRLFSQQAQHELLDVAREASIEREKATNEADSRQVEPEFGLELNRQLDELFTDGMF
ncbi:MAG TPA: roadblock/LC7 domain-containing protein [Chloroflexota bacterium]|nr:roadblock/LC7 domain-containing protein [Chloroflexota bacterium]HUM67848.1 roadblock/LC7 domain-containing protein [Chloroflexota bacterium]